MAATVAIVVTVGAVCGSDALVSDPFTFSLYEISAMQTEMTNRAARLRAAGLELVATQADNTAAKCAEIARVFNLIKTQAFDE